MQSKNLIYALALLIFAGFNTACEKNQEEEISTELDAVTTGMVLELSQALSLDLAKTGTTATQSTLLTSAVCGSTQDTTFFNSFSQGNLTKSGNATLQWTLQCNQAKVPSSVKVLASSKGSLDSKVLSSSSIGDAELLLTGLAKSATNYQLDGSFVQIAEPISKVRNETHFYSQIDATVSKLMVSKTTTPEISGGTVTFKGQLGKLKEQAQFVVEGSIVFHGNKQATLTLNGKIFEIDLN